MKPGIQKSIEGKKAKDAVTSPACNDSLTSPDQGMNVDNSVRDGSPHQMAGDVVVLASKSTHVVDMTSPLKKKPRVKIVTNKKRFVKRTYKYKLSFVEEYSRQFERMAKPQILVADYALDLNGDERYFWSYIVCCNSF